MLHRNATTGQKLDVAGLNEIVVLVDRSETELTEVAMNSWCPGLDGPPHAHQHKEQNFFVTAGRGQVKIGNDTFPAAPGDFFYIPAATQHQSINQTQDRLEYFLFNAFLDEGKEGHSSFADHIEKVKETRRNQAVAQRAQVAGAEAMVTGRKGRRVAIGNASGPILARNETQRCEAVLHVLSHGASVPVMDATKEQVIFVVSGSGTCKSRADGKQVELKPRDVVFLKRGEDASLGAGPQGMKAISFGTVIAR